MTDTRIRFENGPARRSFEVVGSVQPQEELKQSSLVNAVHHGWARER